MDLYVIMNWYTIHRVRTNTASIALSWEGYADYVVLASKILKRQYKCYSFSTVIPLGVCITFSEGNCGGSESYRDR